MKPSMAKRGMTFFSLDEGESVSRNGDDVQLKLNVFDACLSLRDSQAEFETRLDYLWIVAIDASL